MEDHDRTVLEILNGSRVGIFVSACECYALSEAFLEVGVEDEIIS
jgi:hypothetical protein